MDKLFLKFPYKWWPDTTPGFSFLWSADDREQFIKENKVYNILIMNACFMNYVLTQVYKYFTYNFKCELEKYFKSIFYEYFFSIFMICIKPQKLKCIFFYTFNDEFLLKYNFFIQRRGWDYLCDIFGFYIVDNCPNTLLGWIVGPAARKMERKSIDEIKIGLVYLLNKFLGDKFTIPVPDLVTR